MAGKRGGGVAMPTRGMQGMYARPRGTYNMLENGHTVYFFMLRCFDAAAKCGGLTSRVMQGMHALPQA